MQFDDAVLDKAIEFFGYWVRHDERLNDELAQCRRAALHALLQERRLRRCAGKSQVPHTDGVSRTAWRCNACGSLVSRHDTFCRRCGARLEEES